GALAVRLGLAPVRGVGEKAAEQVLASGSERAAADLADLTRGWRLSAAQLEALATAGALADLGYQRREGIWVAGALAAESGRQHRQWIQEPLPLTATGTTTPDLPAMDRSEEHTSELQSRFDLVCRLLLE